MGSGELAVSFPTENIEQSNKQSNDTTISELVNRWHNPTERKLILTLSVIAVFLDPFFFYIPVVDKDETCLKLDNNLRIIIVVFRSFVDVLHTILWWHHCTSPDQKYQQPHASPRWHHILPLDHKYRQILAWTVTIVAILPLPQVVILAISWQLLTVRLLKFIVLIQFSIRLCRIIPAYKDAARSSDMLLIYTWFAAAFNLVMYILASNVLGAFWYLRAVERNMDCWTRICQNVTECNTSSLYCGGMPEHKEYLKKCLILQADDIKHFDHGIYGKALQIIIDTNFLNRLFRCFWWGLQNLSSLGESLETGAYIWDSFFAIFITICGLVLFAFLIGNMQNYLQSKTPAKLERMRQRNTYLKDWKPFSYVSDELKKRVKWCEEPKWQETAEITLESLLNNIPQKLSGELRLHLCKRVFSEIPELQNLNSHLLEKLYALAKPVVFPERSFIFVEGDPINEVVVIVDGNLLRYRKNTTEPEITAERLLAVCLIGEELLQKWIQHDQQLLHLPIASATIRAETKVEAFVLRRV